MGNAWGKAMLLGGSVVLAGSGMLATVAAAPDVAGSEPVVAKSETADALVSSGWVSVDSVQGSFSFNQEAVSSNEEIVRTFNKAASSLCASLPDYGVSVEAPLIEVASDSGAGFSATVQEMAAEEGAQSYTMACACASNLAGGGALANAEVEGVSLATIADRARAR